MAVISVQHVDIRGYRALQFALAASLLLHAILIFLAPGFRAPVRAPEMPTLTAVLRALPQPEEQATRAQAQPAPETPRPAPRPKPEAPKPRSSETITAPSPLPAPSLPAAESAPAETKSAPPPAGPASAPPPVAAAAPSVAASRGEAADPNALQSYKLQLAGYANRYKRYPRQAVDRNWEGIAEVRLTIGADGKIREIVIAASSGHELLDQQAVEMVRKAAPITEITGALRNKEFSVNLPIVFNIERKGG